MVAVDFNPRTPELERTLRRVATPECSQSSLRDEGAIKHLRPWVETHGYHHNVATRRVAAFRQRNKTRPFHQHQFFPRQPAFALAGPTLRVIREPARSNGPRWKSDEGNSARESRRPGRAWCRRHDRLRVARS